MGTVFRNAMLVQLEPALVQQGELRQDGGLITAVGTAVQAETGDEVIDCRGDVLMPGLVNGHTHLYAALAIGMPVPTRPITSFHETLRFVWWRLDRAHTYESVEWSGLVGALNALRCGTTTLIDHHASPNCIDGSLDALQRGVDRAGCRAVLCYETTDRNGSKGAEQGIAENERYLSARAADDSGRFAGMVGAHASFTLHDLTLDACVDLARRRGVGLHIHAAEDPVDEHLTRKLSGCSLLERFESHGLTSVAGSIIAHGTHFFAQEIAIFNELAPSIQIAHAPRSNMNNAVGYTPVAEFREPVLLGTDGIDGDMWTEAKTAYFKSNDARLPLSIDQVLQMHGATARRASKSLGVRLGLLEAGAAADLVLTSYRPATSLDTCNLAGQVIFGMGAQHVRDVMIGGEWRLRDRSPVDCDEMEISHRSTEVAQSLHERMSQIPCD